MTVYIVDQGRGLQAGLLMRTLGQKWTADPGRLQSYFVMKPLWMYDLAEIRLNPQQQAAQHE